MEKVVKNDIIIIICMFTQKAQFSLLEILLPSTVLHLNVLVILAPCVCVCVCVCASAFVWYSTCNALCVHV